MDPQREQDRRTYSLCRLGIGLLTFALMIATVTTVISMPRLFIFRPILATLLDSVLWHWSDTPVVWGSLIGVYLLWGRWEDTGWQRRTGLLLVMCLVDVVLWFLSHGEDMGLRLGNFGHEWLRHNIGQALGWAEFALIASLTCDLLVHLGIPRAMETAKATRSLAATGALLWMLMFFQLTNWSTWPLERGRIRGVEVYLIYLAWNMIWTITLIQVTALTIATTRQCGVVIAELDRQDQDHDLLQLPSEQAALSSAETEGWNANNPYRAPLS